jgi:hypothetical protein
MICLGESFEGGEMRQMWFSEACLGIGRLSIGERWCFWIFILYPDVLLVSDAAVGLKKVAELRVDRVGVVKS